MTNKKAIELLERLQERSRYQLPHEGLAQCQLEQEAVRIAIDFMQNNNSTNKVGITREKVIELLGRVQKLAQLKSEEEAVRIAINFLLEKTDLASFADGAGSEKNYIKNNESTENAKIKKAIRQAADDMLAIYEIMSKKEQDAWRLGETYERTKFDDIWARYMEMPEKEQRAWELGETYIRLLKVQLKFEDDKNVEEEN